MNLDLKALNDSNLNNLAGLMDIEIVELSPKRAIARMPVTSKHHQPYGILHGGASVVLAETIASIGGWFLVAPEGKVVVGQEINANHLRPIREGMLSAEGQCVHQGKNSQVWEIKIFNEHRKLVCISRCTLAVLDIDKI